MSPLINSVNLKQIYLGLEQKPDLPISSIQKK